MCSCYQTSEILLNWTCYCPKHFSIHLNVCVKGWQVLPVRETLPMKSSSLHVEKPQLSKRKTWNWYCSWYILFCILTSMANIEAGLLTGFRATSFMLPAMSMVRCVPMWNFGRYLNKRNPERRPLQPSAQRSSKIIGSSLIKTWSQWKGRTLDGSGM